MTPTRLKTLIIGICAFTIVGLIFGAADETPSWEGVLDGVVLGATIGLFIMILEVFVFPSSNFRRLYRLPLYAHFVVRLLSWFAIIFFLIDFFGPPRSDPEWASSMATSLAMTFVAVSFIMIARLVGQTTLINLLTGKYYHPKQAEYALLMVDLKGSTTIAEEIGNQRFFSFLDRFVTDAYEPIRVNGGEIYKFVGDEIIVFWPSDENFDLKQCLRTWNTLVQMFKTLEPSYEAEFGAKPALRGAIHLGDVVIGQIGQHKQEIAMLGEPMNAASRLLELSGERDVDLIISGAAISKMKAPSTVPIEPIGSAMLRGCKAELSLFTVQQPTRETTRSS